MSGDLNSKCRTCLSGSNTYHQLFDYVENYKILEMLNRIVPQIDVKTSSNFSTLMCPSCVDKLLVGYKFQQLCIESNNRLHDLLDITRLKTRSEKPLTRLSGETGIRLKQEIKVERRSSTEIDPNWLPEDSSGNDTDSNSSISSLETTTTNASNKTDSTSACSFSKQIPDVSNPLPIKSSQNSKTDIVHFDNACLNPPSTSNITQHRLKKLTVKIKKQNYNPNKNTSVKRDLNVEIVENPVKLNNVKVPSRSRILKKHFCIFCKTLHTKLHRHFLLKHKSETEIKEVLNLRAKSERRLKVIEDLRKRGDFLHNTSKEYNTGILIVSRQQQANRQKTADDYVCCKSCKGFFSKTTLRTHMTKCDKNKAKNARDSLICSRMLTQYIHKDANIMVRTNIFPYITNDDIRKNIRYDGLVIKYANALTEKYKLKRHLDEMIRSKLRLLGRFIIEIKKLDNTITELCEIFKPSLHNTCRKAFRKTANWDQSQMWFRTPAVAQNLRGIIKKCGRILHVEFAKAQSDEAIEDLLRFLELWQENIQYGNREISDDISTQRNRPNKVMSPSKTDILKLMWFVKNEMFGAIAILETGFSLSYWYQLVKSTLAFLQIINIRPTRDIERLTINNYLSKEIITKLAGREVLEKMLKPSVSFLNQFFLLPLRGKLGKDTCVILSPLCTKAIELIIKYRTMAGIPKTNEFIFSKNVPSNPYYRSCLQLKKFSVKCGVEMPDNLRAASVRKEIATYALLQHIEDGKIDAIANSIVTNKFIYTVSVPVSEITHISKFLMSSLGDCDDDEDDDEDGDEENSENHDNLQTVFKANDQQKSDLNQNINAPLKRRPSSPSFKIKRIKWSDEERLAVYKVFGDLKKFEGLPSLMQCLDAINNNSVLKNRTPEQLKSWIDNQRRHK